MEVQGAEDLVLPIGLCAILAGQLGAVAGVGEKQVVSRIRALDEPLQAGPDIRRCRFFIRVVSHHTDVLLRETEILHQGSLLVVRIVDATAERARGSNVIDANQQRLLLRRVLVAGRAGGVVGHVRRRVDRGRARSEMCDEGVDLLVHVQIRVRGIDVADEAAELLEGHRAVHGPRVHNEMEGQAKVSPHANQLMNAHHTGAVLVVGVEQFPQLLVRDVGVVVVSLLPVLFDEFHHVTYDIVLRIFSVAPLSRGSEFGRCEGLALVSGDVHPRRRQHLVEGLLHLWELHAPRAVRVEKGKCLQTILGRQEMGLARQPGRKPLHRWGLSNTNQRRGASEW
mmetsp:Transcript_19318/g.49844  ORF Transcript_19318/g.49844 Transcript_19318/m.49844 type:complete len:339 (-) Transcript_19318:31-1047(-)